MSDGGPVPQRRGEAIEGLELFDECASTAPVARERSKRGALLDALLDPDAERAAGRLRGIVAEGADHFVDALLPEVAWRLGEMWLQDRVGFADVTIAAARLQSALREVDPGPDLASGPLVAVVVPQGETHTLGAAVAAWRLRRAGASVMLVMNRPRRGDRGSNRRRRDGGDLPLRLRERRPRGAGPSGEAASEGLRGAGPPRGGDPRGVGPRGAPAHLGGRRGELGARGRAAGRRRTPLVTSRGTRYWSSSAIPLVAPEMLGDLIAAASDLAIVVTPEGRVLSVLTGSGSHGEAAAVGPLEHWEGADLRRHPDAGERAEARRGARGDERGARDPPRRAQPHRRRGARPAGALLLPQHRAGGAPSS